LYVRSPAYNKTLQKQDLETSSAGQLLAIIVKQQPGKKITIRNRYLNKQVAVNKSLTMETKFEGGINIAIKIPKSKYDQTVAFYRDILKLEVQEKPINNPTVSRTHQVKFGNNIVWLDCVDNYTHSETWLELTTNDVDNATRYLSSKGINTCDELEKIPDNMHWITDPAGTVLIIKDQDIN